MPKDKLMQEAGNLVGQLNNFVDKIDQGVDFTIAQAPDVVQQFILWERTKCIMGLVGILIIPICIIICAYANKKDDNSPQEEEVKYIVCFFISAIIVIFCATFGIGSFLSNLSAWIAPKWHIVSFLLNK